MNSIPTRQDTAPVRPAPPRGPGEALRVPARWIRAQLMKVAHPWLRSWALRRIGQLPPRPRVLFICLGNICRSPYAAEAFRQRGAPSARIESAGFIGPDRASPFEAVDEAALRGVDLRAHRSRVVRASDAADFDLVVVMEPGQATRVRQTVGIPAERILLLGDLDPQTPDRRLIPDPFGQGPAAFAAAYERIDRSLAPLIRALNTPSDPRG